MKGRDAFYVGYQPRAPGPLGRFVAVRVGVALGIALAVAAALAAWQRPPAPSVFEFGTVVPLRGTVRAHPYPMLIVHRGGTAGPTTSVYLLAGPAKVGAERLVAGMDGREVEVQGTLIYRGPYTMVELAAGPRPAASVERTLTAPAARGVVEEALEGEIVDSKCHLGAMNPGAGPTHRLCAIRCLRGGLPPLLALPDGRAVLLTTAGGPAGPLVLEHVGVPVRLHGRPGAVGAWETLDLRPGSIERSVP